MIRTIALLFFAFAAMAEPYLGYAYPTGGTRGRRVQILLGGQRMWGTQNIMISGDGVKVLRYELIRSFPFPEWSQRRYLQDYCRNLANGKKEAPKLPEDREGWRNHPLWDRLPELDELRLSLVAHNLFVRRNPLQETPSLRELAIAELEIAPDAEPGMRELRIFGRDGISGPKRFYVDAATHESEVYYTMPLTVGRIVPPIENIPAVLNGRIMPGETDRFQVRLVKDQTYTFSLVGRAFQPLIGDAVPGWFQPVLRLADPDGREEAFADDDYFRIDPVLRFTAKKSGLYTLEIRDNLYRGREDFVYRVSLESGLVPYRFDSENWPQGHAGVITGGKADSWSFAGVKGRKVVLDVTARRLGSPLDAVLRVFDPRGHLVGEFDDRESALHVGENVHKADPYAVIVPERTGTYRAEIADRTGAGGKDYRYVLEVRPLKPDFALYTAQSMINLRPNEVRRIKFHLERREGFDGAVRIVSQDLETVGDGVIPKGATEGWIGFRRLSCTRVGGGPQAAEFVGEAVIDGKLHWRTAVPCDTAMQAFAFDHLLPAPRFYLTAPHYAK